MAAGASLEASRVRASKSAPSAWPNAQSKAVIKAS